MACRMKCKKAVSSERWARVNRANKVRERVKQTLNQGILNKRAPAQYAKKSDEHETSVSE